MTTEHAFLNGELIEARQLSVPVYDAGFVLGATVTEQLRTFGGKLFRLYEHLERFARSLDIIGLKLPFSADDLARMAVELVQRNRTNLEAADELALCVFATPGPYPALAPPNAGGPMVALHTRGVPFRLFADKYESGQPLCIADVRQISPAALPRDLKCRSRMHYYLADQQAAARQPGARALMLDEEGFVLETTTANILVYRQAEGLLTPPGEKILPGISMAATLELAQRLGISHRERDLRAEDVATADEVLMTSTSVCLQPVGSLDGRPIATGTPGPVYRDLLAAWCELTGVDIVAQAKQFSQR